MPLRFEICRAGASAQERFLEFFAATIRNANTREAYFRAVLRFLNWADASGLELPTIRPIHVASYIEMFGKARQEDGSPFSHPPSSSTLRPSRWCSITS